MTKQDLVDVVSTGLAGLAAMVQVLLVVVAMIAVVALLSARARRLLVEMRATLLGGELWIAWAVALVATLGSRFYSEVADFVPCRLCWFQRIAMYPLAVILLVAALRRDVRSAVQYAIWFPIVGALIAIWHVYIQINPEAESGVCQGGVSCSAQWIDKFGYVTIPVLSLTAFSAIFTLLLAAWSRRDKK